MTASVTRRACELLCVRRSGCEVTRMAPWWILLAGVYLISLQVSAQHHRKALYPSAYRIKRGACSLINPTFQRSEEDAGLLFEILLAGMQIRGEDHTLLIPDEELASLRRVKTLEVICDDVLPKKLSDIRRLTADLAQRRRPLSWQDFERTVLTLVYTSQTLAQIIDQNQRELWTDSLLQLFRAVQKDLGPSLETVS